MYINKLAKIGPLLLATMALNDVYLHHNKSFADKHYKTFFFDRPFHEILNKNIILVPTNSFYITGYSYLLYKVNSFWRLIVRIY